jgi:Alpha/beta hydrolase domain
VLQIIRYSQSLQSIAAVLFCLVASTVLSACCDGSDNPPILFKDYLPISKPSVEHPPDIGNPILPVANYDLVEVGYEQHEFFLSGTAHSFANKNELLSEGLWEIQPGETAEYTTRIVVLRPIDPDNFSGTVFVEWFNTTSGQDSASSWRFGHTAIVREGHVWVGVSAQAITIEGSEGSTENSLKALNPDRYGSLKHPGDSFSYDIFSQVSQAILKPTTLDVLGGLSAQQLLATGSAQSGGWLVTYINGIHPLYNPYNGYLLRNRGRHGSMPLSQPPQVLIETPDVVTIRDDLNVPVIAVQSETESFFLPYDREDDSENLRIWEVAGASHTDRYFYEQAFDDKGDDPQFALVIESNLNTCDRPAVNAGPAHWVFNAAIIALTDWALKGLAPPKADRLDLSDDESSFEYDVHGNVLGGIRTPYVDAPAAILSGEGGGGPGLDCFISGTTQLFDAAYMASLYGNKVGYVQAVSNASDDAVVKGFLLAPDADLIKAAAAMQWDLLGI